MKAKRFRSGVALILAGSLALAAGPGCGSTPPGADTARIGMLLPGFERSLDGVVAVAPTQPGPGLQPAPATTGAVAEDLAVELFVGRPSELVGPAETASRLVGASLRTVVGAMARGDRLVPSDFEPLAAAIDAPWLVVSWIDETERTGREPVRPDRELSDPRAEASLARYRAIDGVLEVRLVDLTAGRTLWEARATYTTGFVFGSDPTGAPLVRSRAGAAATVGRALVQAWEEARASASLD